MTDVQRQARYGWDKEPWVSSDGLHRFTERWIGSESFAPRPECIPSPEPYWQWPDGARYVSPLLESHFYRPRPWGSFTPDPEFVRSEVNPILSGFRDKRHGPWMSVESRRQEILDWLEVGAQDRWVGRTEQVESARRVLTKLRDVMEAGL